VHLVLVSVVLELTRGAPTEIAPLIKPKRSFFHLPPNQRMRVVVIWN